jgi:hypothetical protein
MPTYPYSLLRTVFYVYPQQNMLCMCPSLYRVA